MCSNSQLSGLIVPPGPERAVVSQRYGVAEACFPLRKISVEWIAHAYRHRQPVRACPYLLRLMNIIGRACAQLTKSIITKRPQGSVRPQSERVPPACRHRFPVRIRSDPHRLINFVDVAKTQLAKTIVPPGPKRAVLANGQTVVGAGTLRHRAPIRIGPDLHRLEDGIRRADAHLSVLV